MKCLHIARPTRLLVGPFFAEAAVTCAFDLGAILASGTAISAAAGTTCPARAAALERCLVLAILTRIYIPFPAFRAFLCVIP